MLFLILACSAPIEAPSDFNDLLSIHSYTMDEDDSELLAGMTTCCNYQ